MGVMIMMVVVMMVVLMVMIVMMMVGVMVVMMIVMIDLGKFKVFEVASPKAEELLGEGEEVPFFVIAVSCVTIDLGLGQVRRAA